MKKLLLAGLAVVAFAGVAQADTNVCVRPYASLKATYSDLEMDGRMYNREIFKTAKTDWVWGGSVALGLKMCAFRAELEYNQSLTAKDRVRQEEGKTRGDQSYRSYMLNGYFDLPTHTAFHPYGMAGLGMARIKNRLAAGDAVTKNRQNNFAWQVGGGIGYNLDKNWTLDVGYRYVDNGSSSWKVNSTKVKFDSTEHQITAGIRYTF